MSHSVFVKTAMLNTKSISSVTSQLCFSELVQLGEEQTLDRPHCGLLLLEGRENDFLHNLLVIGQRKRVLIEKRGDLD